ncbi:MAG: helix-turn-helix transcriptional regulator [Elusimicrobia bacterium]|nr:helix-turn-helix transcriptional regulator [Elusimicrobiota bacterium]
MIPAISGLPPKARHLIADSRKLTQGLNAAFNLAVLQALKQAADALPSDFSARRSGKVRVRVQEDPNAVMAWSIGQKIRAVREGMAWTQQGLSDRSGIARANVARLEAGRYAPKIKTLKRVAQAMGLSLADLFKEPSYEPTTEDTDWTNADISEWAGTLARQERKR